NSLQSGVAQQRLTNPLIKWETTTMTDVGVDLSLFKNLDITFDWYKKRTTDILRPSQITAIVGLGAPNINDGIVENKGVELGITYRNQITTGALEGLR